MTLRRVVKTCGFFGRIAKEVFMTGVLRFCLRASAAACRRIASPTAHLLYWKRCFQTPSIPVCRIPHALSPRRPAALFLFQHTSDKSTTSTQQSVCRDPTHNDNSDIRRFYPFALRSYACDRSSDRTSSSE